MTLTQKRNSLETHLKDLQSVVVAFSGGVDSALVLAMALETLGKENTLAVTAQSESLAERELQAAKKLAHSLGAEHLVLRTNEMNSPEYRANPVNRCYHCKSELYSRLSAIAGERNIAHIVNGINQDDLGDHRPGIVAAKEFDVVSPLAQAGFDKNNIRELSRQIGLSNWEKPAMPCLSSRIPYGEPVSPEKLSMIEQAEDLLLALGFTELRVRHHGDMARIELPKSDMPRILQGSVSATIQERFKQIGFEYVTLDLEGFRSGRLNEGIIEIKEETCLKSN
jgi:pyridinium-3,5-biscarboxylic acid mononucleotide sulfurtransferase